MEQLADDPLYTPAEAADYLRYNRNYLYTILAQGKLKHHRIEGNQIRIRHSALLEYLGEEQTASEGTCDDREESSETSRAD